MTDTCIIKDDSFVVESSHRFSTFLLSDIVCFVIENHFLRIVLRTGKDYFIALAISYLEDKLPKTFFRVNKSIIINMSYCKECHLSYRKSELILTNQMNVTISRRKRNLFRELYKSFLRQKDQPLMK